MKLKLDKRTLLIIAAVLLVGGMFLVNRQNEAGQPEGGTLDAPARQACDDFAAGYSGARNQTARLALADKVAQSANRTGNDAIAQRARELGGKADETSDEWEDSADNLTSACEGAGWERS